MNTLAKRPANYMREQTRVVRDHAAAMARLTDQYFAGLKRLEANYFDGVKRITDAQIAETQPTAETEKTTEQEPAVN